MTLGQVGRSVGLTYQQIRKYESGENRLSASRLYGLSLVLKIEPSFFFQGLSEGGEARTTGASGDPALVAALNRIGNPDIRHHLKGLIEVLDSDFANASAPSLPSGSRS